MQAFEHYLKNEKLAEKTISETLKDISRFKLWAEENGLDGIHAATYKDLLGYVQDMKKKGLNVHTINIRLNSIRKYFNHLQEEGKTEQNPAKRLHIKGGVKKIVHRPLDYTELEQLYNDYAEPREYYREERHRQAHERNTVILGLMTWQGVHSGELQKLAVKHVNLHKGTIYIPSAKRSNSRELKTESRQVIKLHGYISSLPVNQEKLFECHMNNTVQSLMAELKGINHEVKNAAHIRASVLLHWLKMYSKREVQYMAGHRYISSTEHYEVQELSGLTDLLTRHHPFG